MSDDRTLLTPWWHHASIIAAYAAMSQILFSITSVTWALTAGLRLSCLLLVPRRFWGALFLGEMASLATIAIPCASRFGIEWATAVLIPATLYCIPFVYLVQNHLPVFDRHGRIVCLHLVAAAFLCAVASVLRADVNIFALVMQDGSPAVPVSWKLTFQFFIGTYLGALTITPCVMAIRERLLSPAQPLTWARLMKRSLLRDAVIIELPFFIGLLLAAHFFKEDENLTYIRTAMILPILVQSLRHGWHGAAISGMLAACFLGATALTQNDPTIVQTQAILALVISAWLIWTQRRPTRPWPAEAIHASAWVALLSLIPMQSIRNAFGPRYVGSDGKLYDVEGRMIGAAG